MFRPRSRPLLALAGALAVTAFAAAPASAQLASGCDNPASSQVFAPWADFTNYFLAPDGGFENGAAGWTLDGASVGAGSQSYGSGASSLTVEGGDSATSPSVCVGLEHPTFRFFVRRASVGAAPLRVSVVLDDGTAIPVGTTTASSSWQPSPVMLVTANLLPLVTGGTSTDAAFRFSTNAGTYQVDDVYVDPRGNW
jgi:hypothetical protein